MLTLQLVITSKLFLVYLIPNFSRSRSVLENIRVSNAILSRFDLVFLLLDDPDLVRDKKLSEHVMKLHSRNRKRKHEEISGEIPLSSMSITNDLSSQQSKKMKPNPS